MREWPALPPDDELTRADDLLSQADALLRRHHQSDEPTPASTDDWTPGTELDDDDLPILTEVVEDFELPHALPLTPARARTGFERPPFPPTPEAVAAAAAMPAASTPSAAALQDALSARLAERLVELDTEIAREIGNWVAMEMPQILARELDQLASRVQAEMQAHLRATLLPELSARVGSLLDQKAAPGTGPDRPSDD